MEKEHKFLDYSAMILKVLSWISLAVGFIMGIIILIGGGTPGAPRSASIMAILLGIIYWFGLMTFSEIIRILLEIRDKDHV